MAEKNQRSFKHDLKDYFHLKLLCYIDLRFSVFLNQGPCTQKKLHQRTAHAMIIHCCTLKAQHEDRANTP